MHDAERLSSITLGFVGRVQSVQHAHHDAKSDG